MSGQDQSVSNLERFIGHLVQAAGALQRIGGHIEDTTSTLEPFGHPSDDGLNTRLEQIDSSLSKGTHEAVEALGEAMKTATEGGQGASSRRDRVEHAASDLEATGKEVDDKLHEAETGLVSDGFEALLHVLDTVEAGVGAVADEAVKQSATLENTCEQLQQDSQAAWDVPLSELDEGKAACEQAESSIQEEQTKSEAGFDEQAGHLESTCSGLLDQVGALYDTLETTVEGEGREWTVALEHEREHAAELVAQATKDRLGNAAEMLNEAALPALSDESQELTPVLYERTGPLAEAAEAIAPDAEVALRVIPQIRQMLQALAE